MKTRVLFAKFALLFCSLLPLMAKEAVDYYELAKTGTQEEIYKEFMSNSTLKSQVFGSNRETFLMLALQADRPYDVINVILKAECSPTAKARDKRTPVMYAAQYSSDPAIVEAIISYGTFLGAGKKGRVTAKDSAGRTAFYYAKLNDNNEIYELLLTYAKDPDPSSSATEPVSASVSEPVSAEPKAVNAAIGGMSSTTYIPSLGEEDDEVSSVSAEDENTPVEETETSAPSEEEESEVQSLTQSEERETAVEETVEPEEVVAEVKENAKSEEEVSTPTEQEESTKVEESVAEVTTEETSVEETKSDQIIFSDLNENLVNEERDEEAVAEEKESIYLYDYAVQTPLPAPSAQARTQSAKVENPNLADANGVTLLMKAAKAGNDWDVQMLIANGADVNLRDKDGWSALMYAVRYQNSLSIVQALIQAGAHIRIRNKYNATPLLIAADYSQNPDIIALLLEGRSIAEDEVYKAFIMTITSTVGSDHIKQTKVQLFLERGISVNRIWKGRTPLMYAAEYCDSTAVLNLLLEAGANTATRDADGNTAFDYAKQNRRLNHDDIYWTLNEGVGY